MDGAVIAARAHPHRVHGPGGQARHVGSPAFRHLERVVLCWVGSGFERVARSVFLSKLMGRP